MERLNALLSNGTILREREDILPAFQRCQHLVAMSGTLWGNLLRPDFMAYELDLGGAYKPDYVVACSTSKKVLLVELEDGTEKAFFNRRVGDVENVRPKLGQGVLKGLSQLLDWANKVDTADDTVKTQWFSFAPASYALLLVVGREQHFHPYNPSDRARYEWLQNALSVKGIQLSIRTFDHFLGEIAVRLATYGARAR